MTTSTRRAFATIVTCAAVARWLARTVIRPLAGFSLTTKAPFGVPATGLIATAFAASFLRPR